MAEPRSLETRLRRAILLVLVSVVIVAPVFGCFVLSPLLVATGIQPYPLAAALSVMVSEAIAIALLFWLVVKPKR